jgi:hypothetical protein
MHIVRLTTFFDLIVTSPDSTLTRILDEHLRHLRTMFWLLDSKGVTLSRKKFFLNYSSVISLAQKVDAFGLIAAADRIVAIEALDFSYKLSDLELYLGLSG